MSVNPAVNSASNESSPEEDLHPGPQVHRWFEPIAALPMITAGTGSLNNLLLEQVIDAYWLLNIHTRIFGVLNLQTFYPMLWKASR